MDGNRLINTLYDITFKQDKEHTVLCSKQLTQSEVAKFRKVSWGSLHHPSLGSQGPADCCQA